MITLAFTYTKADGSTSERVLVPDVIPNKMYEGTDISELSVEEQGLFLQERVKLHNKYIDDVMDLERTYDLKHRYRRFDPNKMTNVIREAI